MAGLFTGTPEQSVDLMFKGIQEVYRQLLAKRLTEVAEQCAREAAEQVAARIEQYHNHLDGTIQVHVQFKGVPK